MVNCSRLSQGVVMGSISSQGVSLVMIGEPSTAKKAIDSLIMTGSHLSGLAGQMCGVRVQAWPDGHALDFESGDSWHRFHAAGKSLHVSGQAWTRTPHICAWRGCAWPPALPCMSAGKFACDVTPGKFMAQPGIPPDSKSSP